MAHTTARRTATRVMAVAVAAGMAVTVSGTAFADTTTSVPATSSVAGQPSDPSCTPSIFDQAQQSVEGELAGRVTQLNTLSTEVDNTSNHLSASDRQTLQNDISNVELPGIEALQTHVQQDTTCPQLRADAHSMVFSYRVYLVMTPQTHLTIVADDEIYIEGLFLNLEPKVASAIEHAQSNGENMSAAQSTFNDMNSQVTAAQSATSGLSAQLLAQTPQGSPGNWQVFLAARASLTNARNDLHNAYSDAQQISADLQ